MEALVILIVGAILIVILKKSPEKGGKRFKSFPETISKLFFAVKKPHEEKQEPVEEKIQKEGAKPDKEVKEEIKKQEKIPETEAIVDTEAEKQRLLEEAERFLRDNKLKEAEDCYIKILKIDKKDAPTYKGLGQIYLRRKKYKYAQEIFEKLTELSPRDASSYCNLGICFFKEKKYKKSIENYKKALEIGEKPSYHKNLAITLDKSRKYDEEAEQLEKALRLGGKDDEAMKLMMKILPKIKDKKKAKNTASFLLMLDPENAVLKRELSRLKKY